MYESSAKLKSLEDASMSGYFTFRYIIGSAKDGETFDAVVDPFMLRMDEKSVLVKNSLDETIQKHWMKQWGS